MTQSELIRGWFEIWPLFAWPLFRKLGQEFEFSRISESVLLYMLVWVCVGLHNNQGQSTDCRGSQQMKQFAKQFLGTASLMCSLSETWELLRTFRRAWGCLLLPGRTEEQIWLPLVRLPLTNFVTCPLSKTPFYLSLTLKVGKNTILGDVYW